MACNTCAERDGEAIQAKYFVILNDMNSRKQYIRNIGPVICVFDVYGDFYAYHTGVYSYVTGHFMGSHCVEVVGSDEDAGLGYVRIAGDRLGIWRLSLSHMDSAA